MDSRYSTIPLLTLGDLAPIGNFHLRVKFIVEGAIAGLHQSPYHGFSAEFLEYRPYIHGESSQRIDWRKYAKTDRTVVRLFEDETNMAAHLIIDKSASMGYGSKPPVTKFAYARTLAGALAWILVRQRDAVGMALFDDRLRLLAPPRSTSVQLKTILTRLQQCAPAEQTFCGDALGQVARRLTKRGLCIVISDLMDDPARIRQGLRHLRFKKQDVIVFRILDRQELSFSRTGPIKVRDMETHAELSLDGKTASRFFGQGIAQHQDRIAKICRELAIDLETVSTDEPFVRPLLRVLEKRRRMY
jgi:uncharacterized protein (DUF58 family)